MRALHGGCGKKIKWTLKNKKKIRKPRGSDTKSRKKRAQGRVEDHSPPEPSDGERRPPGAYRGSRRCACSGSCVFGARPARGRLRERGKGTWALMRRGGSSRRDWAPPHRAEGPRRKDRKPLDFWPASLDDPTFSCEVGRVRENRERISDHARERQRERERRFMSEQWWPFECKVWG